MTVVKKNIGSEEMPDLVGVKEFADILGWDKARLSTKFSRQKEGRRVKIPIPDPIQILASTPVWTMEQAEIYKKRLDENNNEEV